MRMRPLCQSIRAVLRGQRQDYQIGLAMERAAERRKTEQARVTVEREVHHVAAGITIG